MARDFSKNTSNYLSLGNKTIGPLLHGASASSIHCFVRADTYTTVAIGDNRIFKNHIAGSSLGGTGLNINATAGGSKVLYSNRSQSGDAGQSLTGATNLGTGTLHSIGGVANYAGDTQTVYVDGAVDAGPTACSFGSSTYVHGSFTAAGDDAIGAEYTPPASTATQFDGLIAEVAIWKVALTLADFAALAKGASPLGIRPNDLVFYMPLWGRHNTERDYISGISGSISGTVGALEHPPVWYPHFANTPATDGAPPATTIDKTTSVNVTVSDASDKTFSAPLSVQDAVDKTLSAELSVVRGVQFIAQGGTNSVTVGIFDLVLSVPAGTQENDILIAQVGAMHAGTQFASSGWTQMTRVNTSTSSAAILWKRASASEPTSYTFTRSVTSTGTFLGVMSSWRGAITTGNPIQAGTGGTTFNGVTASISVTSPTTATSQLILAPILPVGNGWSNYTGPGNPNLHEVLDQNGMALATGTATGTSALGSFTADLAGFPPEAMIFYMLLTPAPDTYEKTFSAVVSVQESIDKTTSAASSVLDTVDKTTSASVTVQMTEEKSLSAEVRVFGSQEVLRPNADILTDPDWTLNYDGTPPPPSSVWEVLDQPIRYASAPNPQFYVGRAEGFGASPAWSDSFKIGFTTYPLGVGEIATRIILYVYVSLTGTQCTLDLELRLNGVQKATTSLSGAGGGWITTLEYASGDGISQAEIDSLELWWTGSKLAGGGAFIESIRVLAAEAELSVQLSPQKTFSAAASVQETVDNTTSAAASVLDTVDKTTSVTASIQETIDKSFSATIAVQAATDKSFAATIDITRYSTTEHFCPTAAPRVLIEIDWPSGQGRYSFLDLAIIDGPEVPDRHEPVGYDGKLIAIGEVRQSSGNEQDSVGFSLVNLPFVDTIESVWSDTEPPENAPVRIYIWFEDTPYLARIEIFRGVIDQVTSITDDVIDISALSEMEKHDRLLGDAISVDLFSDAPEESVGKFMPIVMGTVARMAGVPVTTMAVGQLRGTHLKNVTTLTLEDASRFPSGTNVVTVGDEEIQYTGKGAGNTLTGCTRGFNSTAAADYGSGTEVRENGDLSVLFSGHELTAIDVVYAKKGDRVRQLDPSEFSVVLTPRAIVTFPGGWPIVPVPDGSLDFAQIQFDAAGTGNTATAAADACAEAVSGGLPTWTEKNYALVAASQLLVVDQTTAVVPLGDIVRAWIMVEYDGSTVQSGTPTTNQKHTIKIGATSLDFLTPAGNLPREVKDRAGALAFTRAYNDEHHVTEPVSGHAHGGGGNVTYTQFMDNAPNSNWDVPGASVDGSFTTFTTAFANSPTATMECRLSGIPEAASKGTPVSFVIRVIANAGGGGNFSLQLRHNGANLQTLTWNAGGGASQQSLTTPRAFSSWGDLNATNTGAFATLISTGNILYECWYEITYTPFDTEDNFADVDQDDNEPLQHTVAYLSEITSTVNGDWSWFASRSISLAAGSTAPTCRVIRVSFVVEMAPFKYESAEKILADVRGLVDDGNTIDILKEVLTNAYMMGLTSAEYNDGDMAIAEAALATAAVGELSVAPDGTSANALSLTGGATLHAVLGDDDDASFAHYGADDGSNRTGTVTFPNTTIGTVLRIKLHARVEMTGGSVGAELRIRLVNGVTAVATLQGQYSGVPTDIEDVWVSGGISQATFNGLTADLRLTCGDGIITDEIKVYRVWLTVEQEGPYRLDFAIMERPKASELIAEICTQARLRHFWEDGRLSLTFLHTIADMPDPEVTWVVDDIRPRSVKRERGVLRDLQTSIVASFNYSGQFERLASVVNALGSPAAGVGDRPAEIELTLIADEDSARSYALWKVERAAKARTRVTWTVMLPGLEYRRGSYHSVWETRFRYNKVDVDTVVITATTVTFSGTVWDTI